MQRDKEKRLLAILHLQTSCIHPAAAQAVELVLGPVVTDYRHQADVVGAIARRVRNVGCSATDDLIGLAKWGFDRVKRFVCS